MRRFFGVLTTYVFVREIKKNIFLLRALNLRPDGGFLSFTKHLYIHTAVYRSYLPVLYFIQSLCVIFQLFDTIDLLFAEIALTFPGVVDMSPTLPLNIILHFSLQVFRQCDVGVSVLLNIICCGLTPCSCKIIILE